MIRPLFLQAGDTVSIVAPGRKPDRDAIQSAAAIIERWGLKVRQGKNIFSSNHNYLSGTDQERLSDLQEAFNDHSVQAIICARGGYGTTRILDQLDFSSFVKKTKWVCGFSDITALHLKMQSLNIQSIHGTMPVQFSNTAYADSAESLRKALFGEHISLTSVSSIHNRSGEASGEVVGGNLSLLVDSLGTSSALKTDNKILILEEIGEYAYRLDRMLTQLKRAGKLDNLAGLAVGHMTDIREDKLPFGETVEALVLHHTKEFAYPVAFNFPTGHDAQNIAWIEGAWAKLTVTRAEAALTF